MPKHTLYFSEPMFRRIALDPAGTEGLSSRVSRLCSIALDLIDDNMPTLTYGEWVTFIDVSNGQWRNLSDLDPAAETESFAYSVADSGPECNEKWGVQCVPLAKKYMALPLAGRLAVLEVCRRFWTQPEKNARYDSYRDIVEAHGAKFED